jgi:hypothetical protein
VAGQADRIDRSAVDAKTALGQVRGILSGTDTLAAVMTTGRTAADLCILLTGQLVLDALGFAL